MSDPTSAPPPAPQPARPPPKKPLGVLRVIFAAIGVIVMLLSGGCALFGIGLSLSDSGNVGEMLTTAVLPYAAPPFIVGFVIWWLAVKVGR